MRLPFAGKEGVKITAKMLRYYAEQVAMASFDNTKVWDNFRICMLDAANRMDSKDCMRVLKGISKISEKLPVDHFIDLLNITYNKIESNILNMSTSDLALVSQVAAKVGILDKSLSQALTISFIARLPQSTPNEIVTVIKSLKSLSIETEFYDEIIKHIYKTHSIFPIRDIISILFYCHDSEMTNLLTVIAPKVESSLSKLSDEDIVRAAYLYSINELEIPVSLNIKIENIPENLIPHLLFSFAVNQIDIRDFNLDLHVIQEKIIEALNTDVVGKLIILTSLSLILINTAGSVRYSALIKDNYNKYYEILTNVYSSSKDTDILIYLLECISLFANIYPSYDLCVLYNSIIGKLGELESNNEVVRWVKSIVPYVWLDRDEVGNYCENEGDIQSFPLKNLKTLHAIASNHVIFQKGYPFNSFNIDKFNPPLILPDIKLTLEKIGKVETVKYEKSELLLMNNVCFVPLYPIHYINGNLEFNSELNSKIIPGLNPEIELSNCLIRQNVRNSLKDLGKIYKIALVPYWKWRRLSNDDERIEYLNEVINVKLY